jgi:hypothetical protein
MAIFLSVMTPSSPALRLFSRTCRVSDLDDFLCTVC